MLSLLVKGREELKKWKERKRHYTENFFFFFFLFFFFGQNLQWPQYWGPCTQFWYMVPAAFPRGKLAPAEGTSCLMLYVWSFQKKGKPSPSERQEVQASSGSSKKTRQDKQTKNLPFSGESALRVSCSWVINRIRSPGYLKWSRVYLEIMEHSVSSYGTQNIQPEKLRFWLEPTKGSQGTMLISSN